MALLRTKVLQMLVSVLNAVQTALQNNEYALNDFKKTFDTVNH